MTSELNQLISDEENFDKKCILASLKPLCKFAYVYMGGFGKNYKTKYRKLQTTKHWKKARLLIRDFYLENGKSICATCKKEITGSFTLHHEMYPKNPYSIFNPMFCEIVHSNSKCHRKGNPQKW